MFKNPTENFIRELAKLFDSLTVQLWESITNTASRKVNGSKPGGFRKAIRKVFSLSSLSVRLLPHQPFFLSTFAPIGLQKLSMSVRKQKGRYQEARFGSNRRSEARESTQPFTRLFTPPFTPPFTPTASPEFSKKDESKKVTGR